MCMYVVVYMCVRMYIYIYIYIYPQSEVSIRHPLFTQLHTNLIPPKALPSLINKFLAAIRAVWQTSKFLRCQTNWQHLI